jgi:hypothetical protein
MGLVSMVGDFENYEAFYRAELKKFPTVRKKRRSKGDEPPTPDHTDSLTPPSPASIAMFIQEASGAGEKAMLRFCEYLGYRGYDKDPEDAELLDALISEYHEIEE